MENFSSSRPASPPGDGSGPSSSGPRPADDSRWTSGQRRWWLIRCNWLSCTCTSSGGPPPARDRPGGGAGWAPAGVVKGKRRWNSKKTQQNTTAGASTPAARGVGPLRPSATSAAYAAGAVPLTLGATASEWVVGSTRGSTPVQTGGSDVSVGSAAHLRELQQSH